MSSLQVDSIATSSISANSIATNSIATNSISATGGGQVDGAGLVVQLKEAVLNTQTTIAFQTTVTILTLNFTPKFSDSLILCQGFHGSDRATTRDACASSAIYAGATEVAAALGVGSRITKDTSSGDATDARFQYSYSGTTPSWGTTPLAIELRVSPIQDNWVVSHAWQGYPTTQGTKLYVWEIAQ